MNAPCIIGPSGTEASWGFSNFGPAKSILVDRRLVKAYASWVFRFRSRGT
jgi:hypothetical protein